MTATSRPHVDLPGMRFTHDEQLATRINQAFGTPALGDLPNGAEIHEMGTRQLLGNSIKITRGLLPDIMISFSQCLKALGLESHQGALYVQQSSEYQASVHSDGQRFNIVLSSGIVKDFELPEVRFVIGHELGHVLYKHSDISVHGLLQTHRDMGLEDALLLFRWSRSAEISADRVGLLCAGSFKSSISALFKVSSGLVGVPDEAIHASLQSQYDELKAHIETVETMKGVLRTHPMSPIRFKALELATSHFRNVYSQDNSGLGDARAFEALDRELEVLFEALEADAVPPSGFRSREGQIALFKLILFVVLADGVLKEPHRRLIRQIAHALDSTVDIERMMEDYRIGWRDFRASARRVLRPAMPGDPLDQGELAHAVVLCAVMVSELQFGSMGAAFKLAIRDAMEMLQIQDLCLSYMPASMSTLERHEVLELLGIAPGRI